MARCSTWGLLFITILYFIGAAHVCQAQGIQSGNSSWSLDPYLGQYDFVLESRHLMEEFVNGILDVPKNVANGPTSIIFSKTSDGKYKQETVRSDPKYNVVSVFVLGETSSLQTAPGYKLKSTYMMPDRYTLRSRISYWKNDVDVAEYAVTFSFTPDGSGISNVLEVIHPKQFQASVTLARNRTGSR
ncbi:uncharacterized protein LOC129585346 [Paramacrobiotus metropolitanus]|uniref:uncharacterized protein LOC129585346 n=1 Tax=Paramacrobiotus metropolitanus TaxID=2943436 RepID=UPI002446479B|nr:uncharacterized protein LOC129585346 [Paramacrobiotus metropolitanus]